MLLAVALTVGLSVYAHGLTARPMTDRYVDWSASQADRAAHEPAHHDDPSHVRPRGQRPAPPADSP
jgi:Ca2+/H+ antiporter